MSHGDVHASFQNPNTPNLTSKKAGEHDLLMCRQTGNRKPELPPHLGENTARITDYPNVGKQTSSKSKICNPSI